ncbi:hypothetical protein M408DRAFT_32165, partial [Serendipita vermifera MAFF 305830]
KEISEMNAQLFVLHPLLEQLRQQISQLESAMQARTSWIAPIRRVPCEILAQIFLTHSISEPRAPLTIASVCHEWRSIILDLPDAW